MRRILSHVGEPAELPRTARARGPTAWDDPPVPVVPDCKALARPSPEYVFDQKVQWWPPSVLFRRRHPPLARRPLVAADLKRV